MPHSHTTSNLNIIHSPQFPLDFHAESSPIHRTRRRGLTISRNERRRHEAKVVLDKILGSHYKVRGNGYSKVGSLFITWESTDLELVQEVEELKSLFSSEFGYATDSFQIPNDKTTTALNSKVADFVHRYNSPDNLQIIYYAGHGFPGEEDDDDIEEEQLSLAPRYQGDSEIGDPQALFSDFIRLLRATQSDVLLIVDCCFASRTFSSHNLGKRKFELLASSMGLSPSPGKPGSFTTNLTRVIRDLLSKKKYHEGFPTSILYRHLFHHPELKEFKPLLFDQSQFDYGKIWLRPQKSSPDDVSSFTQSDVALDLKLHLRLTRQDEIGLAMNMLAKELQYLPHVDRIDFQALHAGDADVELFVQILKKATLIKKVIRVLKRRVQLKKQRELQEQQSEDLSAGVTRSSSFYDVLQKPEKSSTQAWVFQFAQLSDGKTISSSFAEVWRRGHRFSVTRILSIRYISNFTGLCNSTTRLFSNWTGPLKKHDKPNSTTNQSNGHLGRSYSSNGHLGDPDKKQGVELQHLAPKYSVLPSSRLLPYERLSWFTVLILIIWAKKDGW